MKTAAIIAEYNPFHNGHRYQIERTRAMGATHIVAVMSGNFVQRGEPAIYDKYLRTEAALLGGADLVVELPLPWAMSGAQSFALGGVGIAEALGCVDMLSFGCECGDASRLERIAEVCEQQGTQQAIKNELSSGVTYAAARERAVAAVLGEQEARLLSEPNNTLAVEYLGCLQRLNSSITPLAVGRVGTGYNDTGFDGDYGSATAIRELIRNKISIEKYVPSEITELYGGDFADEKRIEAAVLYSLRRMTRQELALAPDISEGLENRIYSAVRQACSVEELLNSVKTKRYTYARIKRIVMSLFLGINAEYAKNIPPYIRVLGFNGRGSEILSAATPKIPVIGRVSQLKDADDRSKEIFALECTADDIYALCFSKIRPCGEDYTNKVVRN